MPDPSSPAPADAAHAVASARSSAKSTLDATVINIELTLISIIQGLALGVLAAASIEPLVNLQWQAWP